MTCGFPLLFAGWLSTSASNSQLIASVVGATHVDEAADRPSAQDIPSGQPTSRPWARAFGISTCHPRDEILPRNDPRGATVQAKLAPSGDVWRRELRAWWDYPTSPSPCQESPEAVNADKILAKKEPLKSHQTGALADLPREPAMTIRRVRVPSIPPFSRSNFQLPTVPGQNSSFGDSQEHHRPAYFAYATRGVASRVRSQRHFLITPMQVTAWNIPGVLSGHHCPDGPEPAWSASYPKYSSDI